jgi:hypothetical protein
MLFSLDQPILDVSEIVRIEPFQSKYQMEDSVWNNALMDVSRVDTCMQDANMPENVTVATLDMINMVHAMTVMLANLRMWEDIEVVCMN